MSASRKAAERLSGARMQMSAPGLGRMKNAFLHTLVQSRPSGQGGLIQHAPGIFQELVPKDYEVRLTVVADQMFAAKILSQQNELTKIDWRIAPHEITYEPVELPAEIRNSVKAFMTECGLVYSCLDFIVTPDGRHVFLESNPRGQYLWIEDYTRMPITEAIADAVMTQ